MSMQTGLATSTTQLRSYAPATDVSVAAPAPQLDIARAGPVAAGRNPRTEPGPIRFIIIALAIAFLSIFVVLPLVVVFASAFSKGIVAYLAALAEPEALAAIKLTYEKLPAVVGLDAGRKDGAPVVFDKASRKRAGNVSEAAGGPAPWKQNIRGPTAVFSTRAKKARSWVDEARQANNSLLVEAT